MNASKTPFRKEHTHPVLSSLPPQKTKKGKIVSADEAVRVIRDGDTVATGGFVGTGFPEEIAVALEQYYLDIKRRGT
jgi:propionate CoA-transferase